MCHLLESRQRQVDVFGADSVVRHRPESRGPQLQYLDAFVGEFRHKLFGGKCLAGKIEEDDVSLYSLGLNGQARNLRDPAGQSLSVVMVFGESFGHVLQSLDASGGDDPALAHTAAESLAISTRLVDELLGAAYNRTNRRREPLG